MKLTPYILLIMLFFSCKLYQIPVEDRVDVQYYETADDFINGNISELCYTKLNYEEKGFVEIRDIFKPNTYTRVSRPLVWAIRIDGKNYINLSYSKEFERRGFAQFDVEGKICALIIDKNTSYKIRNIPYSPNGLISHLYDKSLILGKHWIGEDGKKDWILIIDTSKKVNIVNRNFKMPLSKFLVRQEFNEVLDTRYNGAELFYMDTEEVLSIIEKYNKSK